MKILTLDFETEAIGPRPHAHPPKPVSCALLPHRGKPVWLAWGHPTGNNCSFDVARATIDVVLREHEALLCHNLAFDLAVLRERMGIDRPMRYHDTMVAAFLALPYARKHGLKELAEDVLDMPPAERDEVREWLINNGIVRKSATKGWGAFICKAPGDLVGKYAIGDVARTRALFNHFKPGGHAYEREMRTVLISMDMERRGVPVDNAALARDAEIGTTMLARVSDSICAGLRADIDIDSGDQLGAAIESRYGITLPRTATGRMSTARDTLLAAIPDNEMKGLLTYRSALAYSLRNYIRPWAEQSAGTGRVHPQWHSTRTDDDTGARTGRFSSTPNFQNMKDTEKQTELIKTLKGFGLTDVWLPNIRDYVCASKGRVLIGRDYSQIELRLAAEFEDGPILRRYQDEPTLDLHQWAIDLIKANSGVEVLRRIAKNVGFGILYGAGGGAIAAQAKVPLDTAYQLKKLYLDAFPSLRDLMNEVQNRGREGKFITTLGGRTYYAEPAKIVDGAWRDFHYKLLNYLIQGSAADLIKQAMIEYADSEDYRRIGDSLIMTVHDELVADVASKTYKKSLSVMDRAMRENALTARLSVPILSSGYYGPTWGSTKDA